MSKKRRLQLGFGLIAGLLLGILIALFFPTEEVQAPSGEDEHIFNTESRKKLIPEDCQTFFDGCNTCYKTPGEEEAGCTEMFCATYQAPKCLDEGVKSSESLPSCEGDKEMTQCSLPPLPLEPQRISREEAKKLILEGKVKSLFQAHSLEVHLETEEGSFTTQEPKIDEVWKVWKACGSPCAQMQLATE